MIAADAKDVEGMARHREKGAGDRGPFLFSSFDACLNLFQEHNGTLGGLSWDLRVEILFVSNTSLSEVEKSPGEDSVGVS